MIKITERLIQSSTAKDKAYSLKDNFLKGFNVIIYPSGAKKYSIEKRLNYKIIKKTIGSYPEMSLNLARNKATELLSLISQGIDPREKEKQQKLVMTLDELYETYHNNYSVNNKSNKITKTDLSYYQRRISPHLGSKKINVINRKDVESLFNIISSENIANRTKNHAVVMLSSVFNKAVEWGYLDKNPCVGIKKLKETKRDRFLQMDEIKRFFKALDEELNKNFKDIIYLLLFTGLRKSNVLSLKWQSIDFSMKTLRVDASESKNKSVMYIPLLDDVIEILKRRKGCDDIWVFPSSLGTKGHIIEIKRPWVNLLKRANIKDLRLHDLRRTMGSYQAIVGSSLHIIGKSLGHKSTSSTEIYARLHDAPVRKSMGKAVELMKDSS